MALWQSGSKLQLLVSFCLGGGCSNGAHASIKGTGRASLGGKWALNQVDGVEQQFRLEHGVLPVHGSHRRDHRIAGEPLHRLSALQFAISVIGVLVFTGLTAYDTQNIKEQYAQEHRLRI